MEPDPADWANIATGNTQQKRSVKINRTDQLLAIVFINVALLKRR
jgi:hypothetical protein